MKTLLDNPQPNQNIFFSIKVMFRIVASKFITKSPLQFYSSRLYSAGPAPLTVQQIETRILDLLRNYDKVTQDKVVFADFS